ncbi:unnamed protein product [marine sediment metagenome]|uniref:Uncharacterized protein n=1 Tax=marine sediment metagenome TaxID=412755 RepID=X1VQJ7_9ZZZZ
MKPHYAEASIPEIINQTTHSRKYEINNGDEYEQENDPRNNKEVIKILKIPIPRRLC